MMNKNHHRYLLKNFKDLTIRTKLLLSYLILIFIPLGILAAISYVSVSNVLESQIRRSSSQSFDQAYTFLNFQVKSMINSSDIVYFNTDVQAVLTKSRASYENDLVQQNIDVIHLDEFFNGFKNTEVIYRVAIYVPGWMTYSEQGVNFINMDTFMSSAVYQKLMLSKNKVYWLPPESIRNDISYLSPVSAISLLRKIRNSDQINDFIGIIKVSVLESNIKDIIIKASTTQEGVVYLQNSENTIISCSSNENLKNLELGSNNSTSLAGKAMSWETVTIGLNRFAITSKVVENTDWTMISAIPYSEILAQGNKIRNLLLILLLVIGVIAYGLATIISTSTVKRIKLLMKNMEKVQQGELDFNISSESNDEIGKLINSFNYMVTRISMLIAEQYQSGKEIKNAELKALQAQINPHFLYNTLDLINWKAIDNDVPEIALIAHSLAKFYKLSLNKGREIVSIEDEIDHIKNYVQIQNMRFDNRINLVINIDPFIRQYRILKIILQPIVENSILHGILENRNKQEGVINISSHLVNNTLVLIVEDNGIGMTMEKAQEILTTDSIADTHGYGVQNVNQRIKLYYGQQYGLSYWSSPGEGTKVEITIPVIGARDQSRNQ